MSDHAVRVDDAQIKRDQRYSLRHSQYKQHDREKHQNFIKNRQLAAWQQSLLDPVVIHNRWMDSSDGKFVKNIR